MTRKLGYWILDNAELFKYLADIPELKNNAERILLSGKVSSYLASTMAALYSNAEIIAVDSDSLTLSDAAGEYEDMISINESFSNYSGQAFDVAVSALAIETLNTRELTPYLFNLYDALNSGGVLYLSFPDAIAPTAMEKNLYPAWYDEDEMIYMKYYMAGDVANALSMIGFQIKAMEADRNNDLLHVVTLIAVKN